MLKRSWVEIDLGTIRENCRICSSFLTEGQEFMAVVKADAYGHGEKIIPRCLDEAGIRHFAVSNLTEALNLRNEGITGQILILGYTPIEEMHTVYTNGITQAILSEEYAEEIALHCPDRVKVQFAIDTGMNRIGLDADDPLFCEKTVRKYRDRFEITGLFTHLCVADSEKENEFTAGQIEKFKKVADSLSDLHLPYLHCMNSAGGLWHNRFGNLVRFGIVMYGLKPSFSNLLPEGIRPALEWKSVISMMRKVHPGETVGYGRSFKVEKEMTIAVIPTGYADGYPRALSDKGKVFIRGKAAPIVGRVCMDQIMVDVTDIPEARFADEVILLGQNYTADDMAHEIGTIGYEIICGISKRVPRSYHN